MRLQVSPGGALRGQVELPGDKSISHRAPIIGAISPGETRISGFLPARDCLATLGCLRRLGVRVRRLSPVELLVEGRGLGGLAEPEQPLNARGSATTMRLLSGVLSGQPFLSILTGNRSLRRRPMGRIVAPLREMGADIWGRTEGRFPPLAIRGGNLRGIAYRLPVASAQVKSCLLLAGLYAEGETVLREPGPSRDHTERMLRARGAPLSTDSGGITLEGVEELAAQDVEIPGDFSAAAFLIAAASILPGSSLTLPGVGFNPTRTGFWDALVRMGMRGKVENEREVAGEPVADLTVEASHLSGTQVGGEEIPRLLDELPILAVVAAHAQGRTEVTGAAELRVKESDRIATTVQELRALGAEVEETPDGFAIQGPTELIGARVRGHRDHRLAMSLAIAGLAAQGETTIEGAEYIEDSFPGFWTLIESLRS
jgi:3-phosphoshikimate 1-carboxyvinyltransferase